MPAAYDPVIFFQAARQAFGLAEARVGGITRDYQIGEAVVRLCFAGPALVAELTPALEHLALPSAEREPALTILIWDSASTATSMPPCPWDWSQCVARGEIPGYSSERVQIATYADTSLLNMLDHQANQAIYWIQAADRLPFHERGAPLRNILCWWFGQRGVHFIHAGAVCQDGSGVLLVGRGGSGKSTSALACLSQGWHYLSDDYALLSFENGPTCLGVYNTAKLEPGHLRKFARCLDVSDPHPGPSGEKTLLFLQRFAPQWLGRSFSIRALLLPRITGEPHTRLTVASPIAALRAVAPSSIFQLPGAGQAEFQAFARLVRTVPCYWLELGTNLEEIPPVITKTIDQPEVIL